MSSREYAELIALARIEPIGSDRRDLGVMKLGMAILRALGVKQQIDPNVFLPIEVPKPEMTAEEQFNALLNYSKSHNQRHGDQINRNTEGLADPG